MLRDKEYYFAAAPIEEIGSELSTKVDDYYKFLTSSTLVDLWRRSYYAYYGMREDTSLSGFGMFAIGSIKPMGQEGEVASIKVNHYKNILTHLYVLTTNQKQALKARGINSDSQTMADTYLADGIYDFYSRDIELESNNKAAVETCLVFGEGFNLLNYDPTLGDDYAMDEATGQAVKKGKPTSKVYNPFDVIRDTTETTSRVPWYIFHDVKNRYDLASKHPVVAEEILRSDTDITTGRRFVDPTKVLPSAGVGTTKSDLIDVYTFYHEKTPSVPNGRLTIFLQDGAVLFDGALPYEAVPVERVSGGDILGTIFGYSIGFDLLGLQALVDKLYTIVSSNTLTSGMQNFWQPPGNQLTKHDLGGGLRLLESVVKPEALELLSTPAEVYAFINKVEQVYETISGVSAVNRGAAPENLKSGTSLAFVASQAITFSNKLQESYKNLQEGIATKLIYIIRDYTPFETQAVISGKFNRPILRKYTGKDLQNIQRMTMEVTSPISQTLGGKIEIARDLLNSGLIRNPREYLNIITTGVMDTLYESEMSEIINVRSENEDMRAYIKPTMLDIDDHKLHILEHRAILTNDSRKDPQLVNVVTQHILEHIDAIQMLQMANPTLLAIMGETPLPQPAAPAGQVVEEGNPENKGKTDIKQPSAPKLPAGSDENTQAAYEQMF
jgi:hypothetical protein